ncbi:MIP/aquaporin family protein [Tautonia sociabilis]|uniref:Aquaporin family protein n=1 Tax=Tautonia sociabilis TaxID=2080755 RepID=A0A432MHD7_9BACT|nr:MIP/aquaporin family protein [Tautonia sociabilis]RUL86203.1 aquaporin family protein [Tautonia sociabilis]
MNQPPLKSALIGEFLGTALLVLLGDGVVASVVLLGKQADWIVITTGWGLAVMLGVSLSGRLSGGHINPAVTLALASRGQFPWPRVPAYWAAQLAGAFVGALLVYVDYAEAFRAFESENGITRGVLVDGRLAGPAAGGAGVFFTTPAFDVSWRSLFSEILGTFVLLLGVRTLSDRRNVHFRDYFEPLLNGLLVFAIGLSLGGLTGYAINPARDLGPRLAASLLGWGPAVFRTHDASFWIPIVGPLIGGVLGILAYDLLVHPHLPEESEPAPAGRIVS